MYVLYSDYFALLREHLTAAVMNTPRYLKLHVHEIFSGAQVVIHLQYSLNQGQFFTLMHLSIHRSSLSQAHNNN